VRARRIKAIEADKRKTARELALSDAFVALWQQLDDPHKDGRPCDDDLRRTRAEYIANRDHGNYEAEHHPSGYVGPCSYWDALKESSITPAMVRDKALADHARRKAHGQRWLEHDDNRLAYEGAMLADAGGTVADQTGPQVGGACRCWASPRGGWSYMSTRCLGDSSLRTTSPPSGWLCAKTMSRVRSPANSSRNASTPRVPRKVADRKRARGQPFERPSPPPGPAWRHAVALDPRAA